MSYSVAAYPVEQKLNRTSLAVVVTAGAFATIGFDLFGQFISPVLKSVASPYLGAKLAPVALANQSLGVLTGLGSKFISSMGIGHAMHVLTGLFLYPFAYFFVARPLSNMVGRIPWWLTGAVYGIILFVFALSDCLILGC